MRIAKNVHSKNVLKATKLFSMHCSLTSGFRFLPTQPNVLLLYEFRLSLLTGAVLTALTILRSKFHVHKKYMDDVQVQNLIVDVLTFFFVFFVA